VFIEIGLRLIVQFGLDDRRRWCGRRGAIAIFRERFAREHKVIFLGAAAGWTRGTRFAAVRATTVEARLAAAIVEAPIWRATAITTIVAIAVAAGIVAALIALRRSVLRWRQIASPGWSASRSGASAATASTATSEASTRTPAAITTAITTSISTAIAFTAAEILAAAIVSRAAIIARRILLRRIVMRSEILRRRCVRFGLALFEFVVRLDVGVRRTSIGPAFIAGPGYVADIVVLVLVVMLVMSVVVMFAGVIFFTVLVVMLLGVSFVLVMLMLAVIFFALVRFGSAALANGFARQDFGGDGRGSLRRALAVRIAVAMAVIVILKIFEYVADVQESVAVESDIDESGLHSGEHASDAALVDATDKREFLFALDINFD
jgi:hypothetical protein